MKMMYNEPIDIMRVNHRTVRIAFFGFVFAILLAIYVIFFYEHDVDFHMVHTSPDFLSYDGDVYWTICRKNGNYPIDSFVEKYEEVTGEPLPASIKIDEKTYIVTCGYTLERLTYCKAAEEDGYNPPMYFAKAFLKKAHSGTLYIYELDENRFYIERDFYANYADDTVVVE